MSRPNYRMPERLPKKLHTRFRLTTAMLDLWSYPANRTYYRWAEAAIINAGRHVGDSGAYETAGPQLFVDVLGMTTEFGYFLSFPYRGAK